MTSALVKKNMTRDKGVNPVDPETKLCNKIKSKSKKVIIKKKETQKTLSTRKKLLSV